MYVYRLMLHRRPSTLRSRAPGPIQRTLLPPPQTRHWLPVRQTTCSTLLHITPSQGPLLVHSPKSIVMTLTGLHHTPSQRSINPILCPCLLQHTSPKERHSIHYPPFSCADLLQLHRSCRSWQEDNPVWQSETCSKLAMIASMETLMMMMTTR